MFSKQPIVMFRDIPAFLSFALRCFSSCSVFSGALRATASGGRAKSLRDTMEAGAPGQSSARAPERVEVAFAPEADNATILREWSKREHTVKCLSAEGKCNSFFWFVDDSYSFKHSVKSFCS